MGIDDSGRVVLRAHDGETRERLDERLRDGLHADLVSRMPGSPRVLKHVLLITIARGFEPHVAYDIGIRCVKSQDPVPFD